MNYIHQDTSSVVPILGGGALPSVSDAQNLLTWPEERKLLRLHGIEPGMSIVSLGCGSATFEQCLSAELQPMHLAARDADPWAIADARSRGLSRPLDLSSGPYDDLPWPDDSFDVGLCRHALWTYSEEDQRNILKELVRVVRPGGVVYLIDMVSSAGEGQPDGEAIEQAFGQLRRLRRAFGWGIAEAPTQIGVLRHAGLEQARLDLMLIQSADQSESFCDLSTCWRLESVEMGLALGWSSEEIRRLDRGLRAFRLAATRGQATLPVWAFSGRKPGGLG